MRMQAQQNYKIDVHKVLCSMWDIPRNAVRLKPPTMDTDICRMKKLQMHVHHSGSESSNSEAQSEDVAKTTKDAAGPSTDAAGPLTDAAAASKSATAAETDVDAGVTNNQHDGEVCHCKYCDNSFQDTLNEIAGGISIADLPFGGSGTYSSKPYETPPKKHYTRIKLLQPAKNKKYSQ